MTRSKNTKRALAASIMSLILCCAMLIGTTFAWFTDNVSTGVNKIQAGNLNVELEYASSFDTNGQPVWTKVDGNTKLFSTVEPGGQENLWEPGHTEIVYLRIRNAGSLALKYALAINISEEIPGINKEDKEFKLSDYLVFSKISQAGGIVKYGTREEIWRDAGNTMGFQSFVNALSSENALNQNILYPVPKNGETSPGLSEEYIALAVYMPTSVGNEANHKIETTAPYIELGITLNATQVPYERDSFDEKYDENADYRVGKNVSDENSLKAALNNKGVPVKITLENSIQNLRSLEVGGDVELNMANNRFSGTSKITVDKGGNLIINAAKPDGFNKTAGAFIVDEGATLTINGGSYHANAMGQSNITANKNSTVNIKDGSYDANGAGGKVIAANAGSTVNITGGEFGASAAGCTVMEADGGKIIMTGGGFGYVNTNPFTNVSPEVKAKRFSAINGGEILIAKSIMPDQPTSVAEGCSVSTTQVNGIEYWLIK